MEFINFESLVIQIEKDLGADFNIKFRETRKKLAKLKILPNQLIFSEFDGDKSEWVYNRGGKKEIQYHIYLRDGKLGYGLGINSQRGSFNNEDPKEIANAIGLCFRELYDEIIKILPTYSFIIGNFEKLGKMHDEEFILFGKTISYSNNKIEDSDYKNLISDLKLQFEVYKKVFELNSSKKENENLKESEIKEKDNNLKFAQNKNQILYGPPGTGKTYQTINKAIEICNPGFNLNQDRKVVKAEFDRLVKAEQIVFTTFHQSMSYEDFIEGIKPLKPEEGDEFVKYDVIEGVFKKLCVKAKENNSTQLHDNFDEAWEKLIEFVRSNIANNQLVKIGSWEYGLSSKDSLKYSSLNSPSQYSFTITKQNVYDAYQNRQARPSGAFQKDMVEIVDYMKKEMGLNEYDENQSKVSVPSLNYVLIIDEINRGNVSQIFGELITLIEESKRLGNDEALEVTLPYSKETFGVPPNLYIIGTMNTADRSVEALDTALRRRFGFEEMMPQSELLSPSALYCKLLWEYKDVPWENKEFMEKEKTFFEVFGYPDDFNIKKNGIWETMKKSDDKTKLDYFKDFTFSLDLSQVLEIINKRIEILLDRDHTIGHSYFINVISLEDLENTFKNNIIPLLQEYFYNDYEKIALVLGEGFVEIKKAQGNQVKFAKLSVGVEQPEIKTVFSIKEEFNIQEAIRSLLKVNE